jgi:hypothetical protein
VSNTNLNIILVSKLNVLPIEPGITEGDSPMDLKAKEVVPNLEDLRQQVDSLRAVQRTMEESLISATGALDRAIAAYTIQMMRHLEVHD